MDLKQVVLALAGICAAIVVLTQFDGNRDEGAPGMLTALMESSDQLVGAAAGFESGQPGGGAALLPDGRKVAPGDVLTSYRPARKSDQPAQIVELALAAGCEHAPAEGSIVYAFASGTARAQAPLYPVDRADLDYDIERLISWRMGGNERPANTGDGRRLGMPVFDVAVTETSAPVTLVLQTTGRSAVWNIHRAVDASVAQVVLLGGNHAAVAGLEAEIPVTALDAEALGACGTELSFPPPENHVIHSSVAIGIREAEASLSAWAARDRAWATWVETQFGVGAGLPPEDKSATAFVAGPVPGTPEGRAAFSPIHGSTVRMIPADHVFSGKGWKDQYREAVTRHAEAIVGQPLENIMPETVERAAQ